MVVHLCSRRLSRISEPVAVRYAEDSRYCAGGLAVWWEGTSGFGAGEFALRATCESIGDRGQHAQTFLAATKRRAIPGRYAKRLRSPGRISRGRGRFVGQRESGHRRDGGYFV